MRIVSTHHLSYALHIVGTHHLCDQKELAKYFICLVDLKAMSFIKILIVFSILFSLFFHIFYVIFEISWVTLSLVELSI